MIVIQAGKSDGKWEKWKKDMTEVGQNVAECTSIPLAKTAWTCRKYILSFQNPSSNIH